MSNRQAFLLLTKRHDRKLVKFYWELKESVQDLGDLYLLYHQTTDTLPKWIKRCNAYPFSYETLSGLKYTPIAKTLVPGSNHFPVLQFFLDNPTYAHYWCIEDDVRFSGSWKHFFCKVGACLHDFLACHVERYERHPGWYWWDPFGHPSHDVHYRDRIKSFNPIYRISDQALAFIHARLSDQWFGHHEVLLPTLLCNNGFMIGDFGGSGEFTVPGFNRLFYADEYVEGNLLVSTIRWRPVMAMAGSNPNKLYHPVKDLQVPKNLTRNTSGIGGFPYQLIRPTQ